ncbi:MAG TPA: CTB family bacteriocin [Nostocaceae cyanobacterium]|nr:CTB family bacteriocin [Nostocaceae cyanobacterium]
MSGHKTAFNWFIELTDSQLELLTGGAEPQINNNNFSQRSANTSGTNTSGPNGNTSQTNTQFADINSGAQSILSSDNLGFSPLGGFNNPTVGSFPMNNVGLF